MKICEDLVDPKWMYLKAALLLLVLISSFVLVLLAIPTWTVAFSLALVAWSSARLYYFMFYVIERYIDPSFRFSGAGSALQYLVAHGGDRKTS